jgi:hypothetical protein
MALTPAYSARKNAGAAFNGNAYIESGSFTMTVGRIYLFSLAGNSARTFVSSSDTRGETWTRVGTGYNGMETFYCLSAVGGSGTVRATVNSAHNSWCGWGVWEWTTAATAIELDGADVNETSASGTSTTFGSITTTAAETLVVGIGYYGGFGGAWSSPTGQLANVRESGANTTGFIGVFDKINTGTVSGTSAVSHSATSTFYGRIFAIKEYVAPPPDPAASIYGLIDGGLIQ